MKEMKFLWIDDSEHRRDIASSLAGNLKIIIEFEKVTDNPDITNHFVKLLNNLQGYSLIILDQFLDINPSKDKLFCHGSGLAHVIRHNYPNIPLVGITTNEKIKGVDYFKRSIFDEFIEGKDIHKSHVTSKLIVLAEGYESIRRSKTNGINRITRLLKAPNIEIDKFYDIVPSYLRKNYNSIYAPTTFQMANWMWKEFLSSPGLVLDSLWSATFVGLKEKSFLRRHKTFQTALYEGVFADPKNPKWWKSKLTRIIMDKINPATPTPTRFLGRKLRNLEKKDYSVCEACGGAQSQDPPETVGYADETYEEREQVHLRCSYSDPAYENAMFYDEIRIVKELE